MEKKKITVLYREKPIVASSGQLISEIIAMDMPCGGRGVCGKCKVKVRGDVSPISEAERKKLKAEDISRGIRLSCQTRMYSDGEVEAVNSEETLTQDSFEELPLRDSDRNGFGIAADLGTTTICAELYDYRGKRLSSVTRINPQIRYGADVVSRIEASVKGKGSEIAHVTVSALDGIFSELARLASVSTDEIDEAVITGNTAMLSLATNTDATPLAAYPFKAKRLFAEELSSAQMGFSSLPESAVIYMPPCISAFAGADLVCAVLASGMVDSDEDSLLADVGTNGEIALFHGGRLYACTTAAGPAFEGVGIECGMRAQRGAVYKAWVSQGKLKVETVGGSEPAGICGSGLVDLIAALLRLGCLDTSGELKKGEVPIAFPIYLTQADVRAFQLAKSALRSGIECLFESAQAKTSELSTLYLAGGLGNGIDLENAEYIGLLPKGCTDKALPIGNGALRGAAMLLLDPELREKAKAIASEVTVEDLAQSPRFTSKFLDNIAFDITGE